MQELFAQVQRLGLDLARHLPDFDLAPVFQQARLAPAKKGRLLDFDEQGRVVVNLNHGLATRLSDGRPGRAELLVSAIISLVNRAETQLTDAHQRVIHQQLLARVTES